MNDEIKEILEHLKEYLQSKIDNGEHKIFYNDLMWDMKTIDCINAIDDSLDYITNLQQERDTYKEQLRITHKDLENYISRCEKASEYIEKQKKKMYKSRNKIAIFILIKLENILQNGGDSQ